MLYVISGHGAGDPGACSGGYSEATLVRRLAERIKHFGGKNVVIPEISTNWYAANRFATYPFPAGAHVVELHMDSGVSSAKGSHVIIKKGMAADGYDNALAKALAEYFPGRSQIVVGRNDLKNVNVCARRGINYRLVENGFISNDRDRATFINRLDDIAKLYVSVFCGGSTYIPPTNEDAVDVDGIWGKETTRALQRILGTTCDGIVSSQSNGWKSNLWACTGGWEFVGKPVGSRMIAALQRMIGADDDGIMGAASIKKLQAFLKVSVDGYCGSDTVKALQRWINANQK